MNTPNIESEAADQAVAQAEEPKVLRFSPVNSRQDSPPHFQGCAATPAICSRLLANRGVQGARKLKHLDRIELD